MPETSAHTVAQQAYPSLQGLRAMTELCDQLTSCQQPDTQQAAHVCLRFMWQTTISVMRSWRGIPEVQAALCQYLHHCNAGLLRSDVVASHFTGLVRGSKTGQYNLPVDALPWPVTRAHVLVRVRSVCELKGAYSYLLTPDAAPTPCACRRCMLVSCTLLGQAAAALCKALQCKWSPHTHGTQLSAQGGLTQHVQCPAEPQRPVVQAKARLTRLQAESLAAAAQAFLAEQQHLQEQRTSRLAALCQVCASQRAAPLLPGHASPTLCLSSPARLAAREASALCGDAYAQARLAAAQGL